MAFKFKFHDFVVVKLVYLFVKYDYVIFLVWIFCLCICFHMYVGTYVCACVYMPEIDIKCLPPSLSTKYIEA